MSWTSGEIIPVATAIGAAVAGILGTYLGFVKSRSETVEAATERSTLQAIARMTADIDAMRAALDQHEAKIRKLEARIREMQTRGYRWFRWAHDLHRLTLEARMRAPEPLGGWPEMPKLPENFDLEDNA